MFYELIASLTTPCPAHVRDLDYLAEALAMRRRYLRHQSAWQPHLEHTRSSILAAADRCQNRNTVVVLGAGLLLDVPLDELSCLFEQVVLLDIVLLPEVRKRVRKHQNVKLLQRDVTNVAEQLHGNVRRGLRELPKPLPRMPEIDERTGLVVSLNILSQLWVVPRAFALAKFPGLDEELLDDWCGRIVESHYEFLRSAPCSFSLIADHEFVKRDRAGKIASRSSTIAGLVLPEPEQTWTWNIAPISTEKRHLSKELNVGAWFFEKESVPRHNGKTSYCILPPHDL